MKFRQGDTITIKCTVLYDTPDDDLDVLAKDPKGNTILIREEDVIDHVRSFKAGERVVLKDDAGPRWTVLAVNGNALWLQSEQGGYITADATTVELYEPAPVDEAPAT